MARNKIKKSEAEIEAEREKRISATAEKLKVQILTMENKKDYLLGKIIEARQMGLKGQEEQARGLLRKCMASQKQANGMLMTLELAVQSRDLAMLNRQFLDCIGVISEDISVSAKKSNAKKAEKQYLKAMYAAKLQSAELDKMLEIGDYASVASIDEGKFEEYNEEIDTLVEQTEAGTFKGFSTRKTQKY